MRDEPADLRVVVDRRRREEVGLAERAAVGDQQRRRVRDPRPREQLDHVGEERDHRQAVLVAAEAVDGVRQVQLQVEPAFGRRHHLVLAAGLDHPLALPAVADHVGFQRVRPVVLLVLGDHASTSSADWKSVSENTPGPSRRRGGRPARRPRRGPGRRTCRWCRSAGRGRWSRRRRGWRRSSSCASRARRGGSPSSGRGCRRSRARWSSPRRR